MTAGQCAERPAKALAAVAPSSACEEGLGGTASPMETQPNLPPQAGEGANRSLHVNGSTPKPCP